MSGPGFARPDLCSIRTADEQDELAEAVRSGFSADGYPLGDDDPSVPLTSGIDRAIRLSTAAAVLAVAAIERAGGLALIPSWAGPCEPPYVRLLESVPGLQTPYTGPDTGGLRLGQLPGHSVSAHVRPATSCHSCLCKPPGSIAVAAASARMAWAWAWMARAVSVPSGTAFAASICASISSARLQ